MSGVGPAAVGAMPHDCEICFHVLGVPGSSVRLVRPESIPQDWQRLRLSALLWTSHHLHSRHAGAIGAHTATVLNPPVPECNLLSTLAPNMVMDNTVQKSRNGPDEGKRVLVVDDDIDLLLTYEALLQAHDYRTSTAENGAQALKLIKNSEVDAILCDLDMPELSGDLFYFEVGRAWPQLLKRFIFLTGNAENPIYDKFLKSTNVTVLSKPVSIDRLLETLEAVLGIQAKPS
jgi:CheY-like chemotaxis protein